LIEWDQSRFASGEAHARYLATAANAQNAVRLTAAEKRRAVELVLMDNRDWSNEMIGSHVGCSAGLVSRVRSETGKSATGQGARKFAPRKPPTTQPDSGEVYAPPPITCPN
jgi:hypothetical protein